MNAIIAFAEPAPDPDADLIAACAEFDKIEHRYQEMIMTTEESDARDEAADAIYAEGEPSFSRIMATATPTTAAGIHALANTIVTESPDILRGRNSRSALLVAHLMRALTEGRAEL